MQTHNLKIQNPCTENWDQMTQVEKGRHCAKCDKVVTDFTEMSASEIQQFLVQNQRACVRMHQSQLSYEPSLVRPVVAPRRLNYQPLAALLIAGLTLSACQNQVTADPKHPTEIVSNSGDTSDQTKQSTQKSAADRMSIRGRVLDDKGKPIDSARVTLISIEQIATTWSDANGNFELVVSKEMLRDQNLLSFDFRWHNYADTDQRYAYDRIIFSRSDLAEPIYYTATLDYTLMGEVIGMDFSEGDPIVLIDGKEVNYKEYQKALDGESKIYDLDQYHQYHLDAAESRAVYDKPAPYGLTLCIDKSLDF